MSLRAVARAIALAVFLAGCAEQVPRGRPEAAAVARIDHVIVGVRDLEAGMQLFERLSGARPTIGGVHPGQGTRNALLSLGGGTYLELYAPNPAEPVDSSAVRELKALDELTPLGWAVFARDPNELRATMGRHGLGLSEPESGSRKRPDGTLLEWETFGYEAFDHSLAPFFIRWKDMRVHPSRTSPRGCRLVWLRLFDPKPETLANAIRPLGLDVTVQPATKPQMELKLACPRGELVLR